MRALELVVVTSLVTTYLVAIVVPCAPTSGRLELRQLFASSPVATQATHGSASEAEHEGCHASASEFVPKCPCGCDEKASARGAAERVGTPLLAKLGGWPSVPGVLTRTPYERLASAPTVFDYEPIPI